METIRPLVIELLAWVAAGERTYVEAIEAWGSRCPRHTPWEDALADGLIRVERRGAVGQAVVKITDKGRALLDRDSRIDRGGNRSPVNRYKPLGLAGCQGVFQPVIGTELMLFWGLPVSTRSL